MTGRRADEGGHRDDASPPGVDASSPKDADSPAAASSGDELTHVDRTGRVRMVDVGGKDVTERQAVARAELRMQHETLRLLLEGRAPKGDVLATARIAAIQAAKRTSELLPLCHHVALATCEVDFDPSEEEGALRVQACVRARDRTGVEMEALTAASVAALTVYDMLKAVDRGMTIEGVRLEEKQGGRSGHWRR